MAFKHSILFNATTDPKDKASARAHTAGWTEQVWSSARIDWSLTSNNRLLSRRAQFLPVQAAIIGVRSAEFDIDGNKLVPKGASVVKLSYPGSASYTLDSPQACMFFSGQGGGSANKVRYTARGFPDEGIINGEFSGEAILKGKLTIFANTLQADNWKTLVRDLSQPASRILGIQAGGTVTHDGAVSYAVGDYVRLIRVLDTNGNSIRGVFRVSLVGDSEHVTLQNWGGQTVNISGHFRKDLIGIIAYGPTAFDRVGVKKVGAPFEKYRGRRSKR